MAEKTEETTVESSALLTHARRELALSGLFDLNGPHGGAIAPAILEIVQVLDTYSNSDSFLEYALEILNAIARFRPLTPVSSRRDEWAEVEPGIWQCLRRLTSFSRDGGRTWYDLENAELNNGDIRSYEDEGAWQDFFLGDVPIGGVVRVRADAYRPDPRRYNGVIGRIIAARNGYVTVRPSGRPEEDAAQHLPDKLQRLANA